MIALKIVEIKPFMAKLLIQNIFDDYLLSEFTMNTFTRFQISGRLNQEFYHDSEMEEIKDRSFARWGEIKPFAYSIVKGSKTPLSFHITLMLSQSQIVNVLQTSGVTLKPEEVSGLYFHIKFENSTLYIISGTGLKTFTLDKTLENAWDEQVKEIVKKHEIMYVIE